LPITRKARDAAPRPPAVDVALWLESSRNDMIQKTEGTSTCCVLVTPATAKEGLTRDWRCTEVDRFYFVRSGVCLQCVDEGFLGVNELLMVNLVDKRPRNSNALGLKLLFYFHSSFGRKIMR